METLNLIDRQISNLSSRIIIRASEIIWKRASLRKKDLILLQLQNELRQLKEQKQNIIDRLTENKITFRRY